MAMSGFLLADKAGWDDLGVIPDQNIAWIKVIDDIEKLLNTNDQQNILQIHLASRHVVEQ